MIVINGQAPHLSGESLDRLLTQALGERAVASAVVQIVPLDGLNLVWECEAGQPVVIVPPNDAELTLRVAAEVYHRTGTFPVIVRAPGEDHDDRQSITA